MNPLTETRQAIAGLLADAGLGVPVHAYPPASVNGPCVVLYAGSPWLTPRGHVSIDVTVYAATTSNQGALARLEQLAWDVQQALTGHVTWGDFSQPFHDGTSQLTATTIPTVCRLKGTP